MKERKQKTLSQVNGCPQRDRSETEWYGGVQTFMWMCEDNIVEVPFDKEHLFEQILSPTNLNRAYKAVMRNKGCGGIINEGYIYVVDLDLERFFDTVSHSKLIEILSKIGTAVCGTACTVV